MREFLKDAWEMFTDILPVVLLVSVILGLAGLIVWAIISDENDYTSRCEARGGHVIEVIDTDICVDDDNRVLLV